MANKPFEPLMKKLLIIITIIVFTFSKSFSQVRITYTDTLYSILEKTPLKNYKSVCPIDVDVYCICNTAKAGLHLILADIEEIRPSNIHLIQKDSLIVIKGDSLYQRHYSANYLDVEDVFFTFLYYKNRTLLIESSNNKKTTRRQYNNYMKFVMFCIPLVKKFIDGLPTE